MVLNDSFSALFSSPASLKKANESFNESFGDKNTLSLATLFRSLQKEHEQISSILRFQPPTTSQYQSSLNELIFLFERAEDQSTIRVQKLVLSVFLKLAANILTVLGKPAFQPTLYKLAQLIASSIKPDLENENGVEEKTMQLWADRIVIECSIHMMDFPNYQMDLEFNIDNIVDDLVLASGRFQFVKSSVFMAARDMVSEMDVNVSITPESRFNLDNLADEHILRLLMWFFLRQKSILKKDLLPTLFSRLPLTLNAKEYSKSAESSLLDVQLYIVSLSVVSSTTSESGMTMKTAPIIASQLSLTKHQKDCWKAVVDACAGSSRKTVAALSRLRTSQLVDAVRLISDGSEDVRVLFEAWKHCLQPSATYDEDVFEAIQTVTEKYRTKMNSLLAYGPFYTSDASSFSKSNSVCRRDMKTLFPLQFDYEFVNTTEAEHIGTVINSLEGYMSPQPPDAVSEEEEEEDNKKESSVKDAESTGDDTFHSVGSAASDCFTSANNSQFFSPLQHNRDSMLPSAISQIIRDESLANTSQISTKSVILTPTRGNSFSTPTSTPAQRNIFDLSIERQQNFSIAPEKGDAMNISDEAEDEEVDELEEALLESTQKHEKSLLTQKSPEKAAIVEKLIPTPKKDAQTETEDNVVSSGESSIISVKYTPKREVAKIQKAAPVYSSESEEYDDEGEEEDYEDEDEEEEENEEDELNESEMESMMEQILEATSTLFRDRRMKMFGIESQKIDLENTPDDEILRMAEHKLIKINTDLMTTAERLDKLKTPCVTTVITHVAEVPIRNLPTPVIENTLDHDSKQCLGCQSDDVQEAALRRLEQMANEWDAEGNDYLYH